MFESRTHTSSHGDLTRWQAAIQEMPICSSPTLEGGTAICIADKGQEVSQDKLAKSLMELHPWRKGPWNYFGVEIDTEWRSNLKWDRLEEHVDLAEKKILDVGSGNGYYGWRMLAAGAEAVVGCDPTLL